MGVSPYLKLRFPELNDPANVPTDMRELTDDIEAAIGGLLPNPVFRQTLTTQTVTSTSNTNFTPVATLVNPHTVLYLLAMVSIGVWASAKGNVFYGQIKASGYTGLAEYSIPRTEAEYGNNLDQTLATIAPGATLSAQLQGRKLTATPAVTLPSVRVVIQPVGWLKTGTIN